MKFYFIRRLVLDIFLGIIISFILLISSVYIKMFVAYPLIISLVIFMLIAMNKGFGFFAVVKMAYNGGKKAFIVLRIFVIIGAIISIWIAAGTVPAIVYFGIKFCIPNIFILSAFLIASLISFLIGTSFGTIGTVGIAFMVMGRAGGVNVNVLGGAIIAGAYFGDRCSPMSSSANLIANITNTDVYVNIKNMMRTSALPFIISLVGYLVLSFVYPLNFKGTGMEDEILRTFKINPIVLLPALSVLTFALFKVEVKISMAISIVIAFTITILVQHETILNSIKYIMFGFSLNKTSPLRGIMQGGGILSMLKVATVVFISSAFAGVFEGAGILKYLEGFLDRANKREHIFIVTILLSIATAAFGCSQTLAIILTNQLAKRIYNKNSIDNYGLALDIENTAVVISPLIPWNIAGLVPATSLGITAAFIPFAFYLYLIPLLNIIFYTKTPKIKNF
jgi:Na+:H+ antiporter, NhaC family